jgi:hypothetical protein
MAGFLRLDSEKLEAFVFTVLQIILLPERIRTTEIGSMELILISTEGLSPSLPMDLFVSMGVTSS